MISSVGFVPRSVLQKRPVRADVTPEDLIQLRGRLEATMRLPEDEDGAESEAEQRMDMDDKAEAIRAARAAAARFAAAPVSASTGDPQLDEAMKELHFENYDSDDDVTRTSFLDTIVAASTQDSPVQKDETAGSNDVTARLSLLVDRRPLQDETENEDSDDESIEFDEADVVFIATRTEDVLSTLEVWLYEEADDDQEGNLFVHHDIPLAHFPLCCDYVDVHPGSAEKCNLAAVGCMECDIELYDLDVLDPIAPVATLHAESRKKRGCSTTSLAVSETVRNVMASGGDDKRVRIWDISTGGVTSEMKLHRATVQCVKWNPNEPPILVSGGHDQKCSMVDVRVPDGEVLQWQLGSDNECLAWCLHQHTSFLSSNEEGTVQLFDARKGSGSDAVFNLAAHKDNATVVSVCPLRPSLFMTGSEDGKVKIWNLRGAEPEMVVKRHLGVGEVLAGGFCRHVGYLVVGAGENGALRVWDTRASASIQKLLPESIYIPRLYKSQTALE